MERANKSDIAPVQIPFPNVVAMNVIPHWLLKNHVTVLDNVIPEDRGKRETGSCMFFFKMNK